MIYEQEVKIKTGGREAQRRFFSQVRLYFKDEREKRFFCSTIYKKNNILLPFEVTAEEMELLYDKFKEDFLLFGYSLDFYKS